MRVRIAGGEDVVAGVKPVKEAEVLERPCHAHARDLLRPCPGHGTAEDRHPPPLRPVQPADHVEQCRLAGPIRADDAIDVAGPDREADVVQGGYSPETPGDALGPQRCDRVLVIGPVWRRLGHVPGHSTAAGPAPAPERGPALPGSPARPSGAAITVATTRRPYPAARRPRRSAGAPARPSARVRR